MSINFDLLNGLFSDQFEKPRDCIGLPARLVLPHLKTFQSQGIFPKKVDGIIDNIRYPLYVFPVRGVRSPKGERATIESIQARKVKAFLSLLIAFYGHHEKSYYKIHTAFLLGKKADFVPVIVPAMGSVHVFENASSKEDGEQIMAMDAYKTILRDFSALSHLNIRFRANTSHITTPYTDSDGVIEILTSCVPQGDMQEYTYIGLAYGHWIKESGEAVLSLQPTPGRGTIVTDSAKTKLAQIVGNNWYLMIPVFTHYNITTSNPIFTGLLDGALSVWLAQKQKPVPKKPRSVARKSFSKHLKHWNEAIPVVYRAMAAQNKAAIKTKYDEIAMLEQEYRRSEAVAQGYERSDHYKNFNKRAGKYYKAVLSMPEVERLTLDNNGCQIWTKTLIAVHEDVHYELGEFVIRLSRKGTVGVWCERSAHPNNEPHPHYPRDTTPCYGNAGDAIRAAAVEMQVDKVARYVIRWLTQGYTPATTLRPITEWPIYQETKSAETTSSEDLSQLAPEVSSVEQGVSE